MLNSFSFSYFDHKNPSKAGVWREPIIPRARKQQDKKFVIWKFMRLIIGIGIRLEWGDNP